MQVVVDNLVKCFGKVRAVDGISFSFDAGQTFGFVGPNGAGKTTTMRIMSTLIEPTRGDVYINGVSVSNEPEKTRGWLGFMPDALPEHKDLTVRDYLDFFARAYKIPAAKRRQVIEGVESFTQLEKLRGKYLKELSKGMKQRVSLARTLLHDPSVLILDEPAAGLDPRARIELRELLKILSAQKKAILISSHILTELEELCDGAVIIEQGRLLRAGTIASLYQRQAKQVAISIRFLENTQEACRYLLERPGVENAVVIDERTVEVAVEPDAAMLRALLAELIHKGYAVYEFKQLQADLEDIFMNVTKGTVS